MISKIFRFFVESKTLFTYYIRISDIKISLIVEKKKIIILISIFYKVCINLFTKMYMVIKSKLLI